MATGTCGKLPIVANLGRTASRSPILKLKVPRYTSLTSWDYKDLNTLHTIRLSLNVISTVLHKHHNIIMHD